MRIKSLPENYAGALAPILYEIDQTESSQIVTVEILADNDAVAGQKRLSGESSYTVNTANYCGGRIAIEPVTGRWVGPGKAAQRCAISKIKVDSIMSAATYVTGGINTCREKVILSDSAVKHDIAVGEMDEIAIIAPGLNISAKAKLVGDAGSTEVALGSAVCEAGIYVMVVDTTHVSSLLGLGLESYKQMVVEVSAGGNVFAKREYSIVPATVNSVRLCWQNTYGQVDYHTFQLVEENMNVDKSQAYLAEGYVTTGLTEEVILKAVSKCEPRKTIKWLAGILAAPQVWMVEDDGFTKVDIMTRTSVISDENPRNIGISFRRTKRLTLKRA